MDRRATRKIRLTDQDLELLGFLAEHRLALPDHAAKLLGVQPETAKARLSKLVDGGYVRREPLFRGKPPMYLIDKDGLDVVRSSLPVPRIDLRTYEHDVGTAWLWLAARAATFGPLREVLGERRLRSHDGAREPGVEPFGVRLGGVGPRGQERLHYPDLLLRTAEGRRIALELELSSKGPARLATILTGYGADPRIDGVVYLVRGASVARTVQDTARRLGISSLVHLQRVRLEARDPAAARGFAAGRTTQSRRAGDAARGPGHFGPGDFGAAHPGPAHSGPAHSGPAHPGPAHPGPATEAAL